LRIRVQKRNILTDGIQGCNRLLCEILGRNGIRQNEGTPRFGCLQLTHLRETHFAVFAFLPWFANTLIIGTLPAILSVSWQNQREFYD
jgi:hypothetical protein